MLAEATPLMWLWVASPRLSAFCFLLSVFAGLWLWVALSSLAFKPVVAIDAVMH
jgi:hypothetical protein